MMLLEIFICMLFAGFFAGLETGLLAADQLLIYSEREMGIWHARAADFLLKRPERLLGTTLIGTNIAVVTAAVLLNSYLRARIEPLEAWLASLALSLLLLVFSEIIPKSFFRKQANTISVRLSPILVVFHFLFLPLSFVLNGVIGLALVVAGQQQQPRSKLPQSREDLRLLVRLSSRESGLEYSDYRIFEDIFDFRGTLAREAMLPLHEYPVCWIDQSPRKVVEIADHTGVRFVPICRDRTDNVVGYVDMEEMVTRKVESLAEITREPVFYPDTKKVPELLLEMNQRKLEVVFLADEYGAIAGLITPREIASEIVGVIPGKSSLDEEEEIRSVAPGIYLVPGSTDLEELSRETGISVRRGNYDTVGGFLCERLGEIPEIGATFEEGGVIYRVVDRDPRHIKLIELRRRDV
jgi:CBS domain containing-hemolysin-like protein